MRRCSEPRHGGGFSGHGNRDSTPAQEREWVAHNAEARREGPCPSLPNNATAYTWCALIAPPIPGGLGLWDSSRIAAHKTTTNGLARDFNLSGAGRDSVFDVAVYFPFSYSDGSFNNKRPRRLECHT